MGEHTVPSGPVGNPRTATRGQQNPTTCKHSHGLVCGAAFRARGSSSQELGRARHVPATAFREVFLKKLKFCCRTKWLFQFWAALWSRAPLEAAPGRDKQELGHLFTCARTTLPHHAAGRHLEGSRSRRAACFALTQFVSCRCIQASSAVRLQAQAAPCSPREPAEQTLNVTAITRRLPQPQHCRHQSCSTSPAAAQPGEGGWEERPYPSSGTCSGFN